MTFLDLTGIVCALALLHPFHLCLLHLVASTYYILLIFAALPQLFVEVSNLAVGFFKHGRTEHVHDHQ